MTKRLMMSIFFSMLIILVISVLLTVSATSKILGDRQEALLREVVDIVANGYIIGGEDFVSHFSTKDYRVMIISPTGKILNETLDDEWYLVTDQIELELFLSQVIENDPITSTRLPYLGGGTLIMAGLSLPDSTIIVATTTLDTFFDTIDEMKLQIFIVALFAMFFSILVAKFLSFVIIRPLNDIDVESAEPIKTYEEINPLINKIRKQKLDIARQQLELKQGQTEFATVSESLSEGLFLVNSKNEISYINKAAITILDLAENPLGKDYATTLPEEIANTIKDTKEGQRGKCFYSRSNRTYRVQTTSLTESNASMGTSVLIYDITSQLNIENRQREFTANVSHELKTPLHIISGSAELLKSGLVKDEDKKKFVDQIYDECQRMNALIANIISLSKMEELGRVEKSAVSTYMSAESVIKALTPVAIEQEKTITLIGDDSTAYCNGSMLYRALFNLVDNAIKYSNKKGRIEVTLYSDEDNAYISVKDNGIGIPEEYHDRVYERFFRVDKSRSKAVGGTGLGLAIAKDSCIANGGDLAFESKKGKGSTFTIRLPKYKEGQIQIN